MSELHFPNLTIKGFRGIRELTIPQLGRVNLITGKNNSGKSSVLEALRLHASNADPRLIYEILEFREEAMGRHGSIGYLTDLESLPHIAPLFYGFPQRPEQFKPIEVTTIGELGPMKMRMRVERVDVKHDTNGGPRVIPSQAQPFDDPDGEIGLVVNVGNGTRSHRMESILRYLGANRVHYSVAKDTPLVSCILVGSHSGARTTGLGDAWDSIALTDMEQEVLEALRIIEPRISAISMIGSEGNSYPRKAIVRAEGIPRPVPLRYFWRWNEPPLRNRPFTG